jgi:hypothetical protein
MFSLVGNLVSNKCCLPYMYSISGLEQYVMYEPPYLKSKSKAILYSLQQSYVHNKKKTETLPIYFCLTR